MTIALILFPIAAAILSLVTPWNKARTALIPIAGVGHSATLACILANPAARALEGSLGGLIALDSVGSIVMLAVSALFLLSSFYAVGYLNRYKADRSNRVFVASLCAFLGLISLAACSRDLGLLWVAIEGTTLVTAPLIYFNRSPGSIEATWKYLLVGSVGIALALFGTFFLAYSSQQGYGEATLDIATLVSKAPELSAPWLKAAFILLLVGYGTKMGLAPMHTWKPDAYGEAPAVVGAILSGGVTSGAFLALLRVYGVVAASGQVRFASTLLVLMGLLSMATAGVFMINQRDFKRMLAYSSVEHMGILALGVGIGGVALWGALLHVVMNSITKGTLFLSAGNIHRAYHRKSTDSVQGAFRRVPLSASVFLAGFFAITGSPPFGPFVSEFSIVTGAFSRGHALAGALFLAFLLVVFVGMGITVLKVFQGTPPDDVMRNDYRETALTTVPTLLALALVVTLGLYLPPFLGDLLSEAVTSLGGTL
jgi:hydrogenase-4 component F